MRFTILSSGSTGNATLIENDDVRILIDVGFSTKKMEHFMSEVERVGQEIDAILITHEHDDHIKGLGTFARKYNLPIYANQGTWEQMSSKIGEIDEKNKKLITTNLQIDFGSIKVESFAISHDAAEPVGYCLYDGDHKISVITDLGYISGNVKEKVKDSHGIILETNHDVNLVRLGKYPWHIKQRIIGDKGHLSNESAAIGLAEILSNETSCVYMAHLSQNHNHLDIAREVIHSVLKEYDICLSERKVRLMDTYHNRPTAWEYLNT
jgi:phosphoribosyl 1,2-cyclic phosphodiesterase